VAIGGLGFVAGEIDGYRADIAITAQRFEEGVGHKQVAVGAGVHAIATGDFVVFAVLCFGFGHGVEHGVVNIGEGDTLGGGDFFINIAELAKGFVIDLGLLSTVAEGG